MNERFVQSQEAVVYAREALHRGDRTQARQWAERAADLAPQSEDPWLILAAVASPRESVAFIRKALQANPESPRAKKGMEWALARLRETPNAAAEPLKRKQAEGADLPTPAPITAAAVSKEPMQSKAGKSPTQRKWLIPVLLLGMGCIVLGFAVFFAVTSPVLASILRSAGVVKAQPAHPSFARVEIPKPTYAVPSNETLLLEPTALPTEPLAMEPSAIPTDLSTSLPTDIASITETSALEPASTPEATSTPGIIYAEIVPDTPTPEYLAPVAEGPEQSVPPVTAGDGVHWIDVDLSEQRVYAYAGDTIVNSFLVSTGTWQTPTVTGKYKIWIKLRSTDMAGPGYYLPDVPYTMYFYKGYGLHGTYWHSNFGTPMSHGCVNLSIPDAAWLYDFAYEGTVVNVHN
jgi:lipoprotein-anchoring transpeptidase ErfK/SrfK